MTDTVYAEGYKADVWKEGKPEKVSDFGIFTVSQPDENGKVTVTGTAKNVSGFKGFNSTVAEERSGYYVAWQFSLTPQENGNLDSVKIYHQSGEQYKCVEAKNLDTYRMVLRRGLILAVSLYHRFFRRDMRGSGVI